MLPSNKNKNRQGAGIPKLRRQQASRNLQTNASSGAASPGRKKQKDGAANTSNRRANRAQRFEAPTAPRKRANAVYSRATRDTGPSNAPVQGRQRSKAITAADDARGPQQRDLINKPITKADDGTELWDGSTPPELGPREQDDVLANLEPLYDLGKGRLIYPTSEVDANGKPIYAPRPEDANNKEKRNGIFISIVPERPLDEFVRDKLTPQEFEANGGTIEAYALADVKQAFAAETRFVVHTQRYLDAQAKNKESLQQKWV